MGSRGIRGDMWRQSKYIPLCLAVSIFSSRTRGFYLSRPTQIDSKSIEGGGGGGVINLPAKYGNPQNN